MKPIFTYLPAPVSYVVAMTLTVVAFPVMCFIYGVGEAAYGFWRYSTFKAEYDAAKEERRLRAVGDRFVSADDLWWEFVWKGTFRGHHSEHCGLCGQVGIIDTRGRAVTPAGVSCGVVRFCICPNGRSMKKQIPEATDEQIIKMLEHHKR